MEIEKDIGIYFNQIKYNKRLDQALANINNYSKDLYDHSLKVAIVSASLGNSLGVDTNQIFLAGLFHDYGKILISKEILEKPGNLNEKEKGLVMQHPFLGYVELKRLSTLSEIILQGILDHHEKINGEGYSFGKRGSDISVFGKIVAIADVYCAMRNPRVYRPWGFSIDEIKEEIRGKSGESFDPVAVRKFLQLDLQNIEDDYSAKSVTIIA